MSFTKITNQDIVSNGHQSVVGDTPNLSPDELKQFFDQLPTFIANKLNALYDDLVKKTTTSGAELVGCSAIAGVNSDESGNIREMLVDLKTQIDGFVQEELVLPDRTITEGKLALDAVMESVLTGYIMPETSSPLSSTDRVVQALGKLEKAISNIIDGTATANKASNFEAGGNIESTFDSKQPTLTFDSSPTVASNNPVTSDGLVPINTLTSTSTSKALSAAKGKDLKEQIDLKPNLISIKNWSGEKTSVETDAEVDLPVTSSASIVAIRWKTNLSGMEERIDLIKYPGTGLFTDPYCILGMSATSSNALTTYGFRIKSGYNKLVLYDAYKISITSSSFDSGRTGQVIITDIYKVV